MTTTIVRVPVPQRLWDDYRKACAAAASAELAYVRASAMFDAVSTQDTKVLVDRDAELDLLFRTYVAARNLASNACQILVDAETRVRLGLK